MSPRGLVVGMLSEGLNKQVEVKKRVKEVWRQDTERDA
jgi:hypothetical protein